MIVPETIESDEIFFNPGWFPFKEKTLYRVEESKSKLPIENENILRTIFVTAATERIESSRSIYNLLDFLGDVGGLREAFRLISGSILGLIGQGGLAQHLLKRLFYKEPDSNEAVSKENIYA